MRATLVGAALIALGLLLLLRPAPREPATFAECMDAPASGYTSIAHHRHVERCRKFLRIESTATLRFEQTRNGR